jgi:transcriptional regulator with XRE-family HTH domain
LIAPGDTEPMEDQRVGEWVRSERRRLGLRQKDLAAMAGVSDSTISRIENGRLTELTVRSIRTVAAAVGIQVAFSGRSLRGAAIERQVDWRHAALVEAVLERLTAVGWQTVVEYSFNHFGDRGSVDVLAWWPASRALLIIEVKSDLRDIQAALHALDVKRRIVPRLVREDRGWAAESLGVVVVLADLRVERGRVGRHGATFDAALPARTIEVRRWLAAPLGSLRGVWFLQIPRPKGAMQLRPGHGPVRRPVLDRNDGSGAPKKRE